jgi:hypothetical protein
MTKIIHKLFVVLSVLAFCSDLMAQGYVYTFHSTNGTSALDGSYVILSNNSTGAPTIADLMDIKILDSYGASAIFDVTVADQGFAVTSFDAQGFHGSISGASQSYFPPTSVTFVGVDSTPGIIASNNGFFPGNPLGEAVFGEWLVTAIPEPSPVLWLLFGLAWSVLQAKRSHPRCQKIAIPLGK